MFAGHLGAQPMHLIQPHQRSLNICDVPGTTLARETKQTGSRTETGFSSPRSPTRLSEFPCLDSGDDGQVAGTPTPAPPPAAFA